MSTSTTTLWCYSLDDEVFKSGSFLTKGDAVIDAIKEYEPEPGAVIHIARSAHPDLSELFDVNDLIEGAMGRADDIAGEYADDFPDITDEEKAELEKLILSYLKPLVPVTFYRVYDSQPYTITMADLEAAAYQIDAERATKQSAELDKTVSIL
ncbi:hypothetical protein [Yokenella regensburgei]|uniref:hypothetical protein n=1 Tax=Yokenella regensburgei TaxID=158877 RepID=UPI0013762A94|nr:hypothetical protein [Yokenella regensburgei]KAF1366767.1 ribonucleotide reductase alpha subunit [Yokenella regensburgei]